MRQILSTDTATVLIDRRRRRSDLVASTGSTYARKVASLAYHDAYNRPFAALCRSRKRTGRPKDFLQRPVPISLGDISTPIIYDPPETATAQTFQVRGMTRMSDAPNNSETKSSVQTSQPPEVNRDAKGSDAGGPLLRFLKFFGRDGVWLGVVIGAVVSMIVVQIWRDELKDEFLLVVLGIVLLAFGAALGLAVIIVYRDAITQFLFGVSNATLKDVAIDLRRFGKASLQRKEADAYLHGGRLIRQLAAIYSWITLRSWVVSILLSLSIAFVSVLGTVLLIEQNKIIHKQNESIDKQNTLLGSQNELINTQAVLAQSLFLLQEGARRQANIGRLSTILQDIAKLEKRAIFEINQNTKVGGEKHLPNIAPLSEQYRPYWIIDAPSPAPKDGSPAQRCEENSTYTKRSSGVPNQCLIFVSPERGLMMQSLIASGVSPKPILLSMGYADLRGLTISFNRWKRNTLIGVKAEFFRGSCRHWDENRARAQQDSTARPPLPELDFGEQLNIASGGAHFENVDLKLGKDTVLENASLTDVYVSKSSRLEAEQYVKILRTARRVENTLIGPLSEKEAVEAIPFVAPKDAKGLQKQTGASNNCIDLVVTTEKQREKSQIRKELIERLSNKIHFFQDHFEVIFISEERIRRRNDTLFFLGGQPRYKFRLYAKPKLPWLDGRFPPP